MKEETETRDTEEQVSNAAEGEAAGASAVDENGSGSEAVEGMDEVEAEVDELRGELQTLNDQHLRLAAEFDNYRKRNERERRTLAARLQADLISNLLDVLDDLQRVADPGADASAESLLEGARLVEKKFISTLEAAGLEPIDAEGEAFDPEFMEALMMVPTEDPEKDDQVADVFQRGYRLRNTLIRPARVRVWQYDESGSGD